MRHILIAPAAAALLVLSGCAGSADPSPASQPAAAPGVALAGGEWSVFEINGAPIVADSKPTINFADGKAFGAASCNRFAGGYTVSADGLALQMSQMASTMMACPDSLMQQERSFLDTLGTVTGYSVDAGVLTLKGADGKTIRARR